MVASERHGSKRRSLRRKLAFAGIAFGVALVCTFVLGEIFVRSSSAAISSKRYFAPGIYAADADRLWKLKPNYEGVFRGYTSEAHTTTNSLGCRGPEQFAERLGASLRVLVVGDSVAFGLGVSDGESYAEQLEKSLREKGTDCAIFNFAVPGYDSNQEAITVEQNVDKVRPHIVLLSWYRNDITSSKESFAEGKRRVIDGYLIENEEAYRKFQKRVARRSWRGSAFLRYLSVKYKLFRKRVSLSKRSLSEGQPDLERLKNSVAELNRIRAVCLERGIHFVVVLHPNRAELPRDPSTTLVDAIRKEIDIDKYRDMTTVVSLTDFWRERQDDEKLYLLGDRGHPSAFGHASIRTVLAELPVFALGRKLTTREDP